jgi:hypothetical protein
LFADLSAKFEVYRRRAEYADTVDQARLLFRLLPVFSYSRFVRAFPVLGALDACFVAKAAGICRQTFVEPKLSLVFEHRKTEVSELIEMMKMGVECKSPIYGFQICQTVIRLIECLLSDENFAEVGADELTTFRLFLILQGMPPHFISKVAYMSRMIDAHRDSFREFSDETIRSLDDLQGVAAYLISLIKADEPDRCAAWKKIITP